jgi:AcrR family transcriptional regulator
MTSYQHRVGRVRSEQTKIKILDATLTVYAKSIGIRPFSAEEIMQEAGISRGTFYRYFESATDAETSLGHHLTDEIRTQIETIAKLSPERPALRSAVGAQALMLRGACDPKWGKFVTTSTFAFPKTGLYEGVTKSLIEGRKAGIFHYETTDVAADFCIGSAIEGIRALSLGRPQPFAFIMELVSFILRGIGLDRVEAEGLALEAAEILKSAGPTHLPWWSLTRRIEEVATGIEG